MIERVDPVRPDRTRWSPGGFPLFESPSSFDRRPGGGVLGRAGRWLLGCKPVVKAASPGRQPAQRPAKPAEPRKIHGAVAAQSGRWPRSRPCNRPPRRPQAHRPGGCGPASGRWDPLTRPSSSSASGTTPPGDGPGQQSATSTDNALGELILQLSCLRRNNISPGARSSRSWRKLECLPGRPRPTHFKLKKGRFACTADCTVSSRRPT